MDEQGTEESVAKALATRQIGSKCKVIGRIGPKTRPPLELRPTGPLERIMAWSRRAELWVEFTQGSEARAIRSRCELDMQVAFRRWLSELNL